jgi:hypothetical protein
MRNHIAHNNTAFLEEIKLSTGSGTIVLKRNCSNEEFAKFTIEFIALLNHSFTFLSNWDKVCLGKWKSDDFVPKHKSE